MKHNTVIITGGNAGIGKAIAIEMARLNWHVVIVSRSSERGHAALEEIKIAGDNPNVSLEIGDLGTLDRTMQLAESLTQKYSRLKVLINNAGIWPTRKKINLNDLEEAFMVNHMAPFILSAMLFPLLRANAPARIINVNAGLYVFGRFDLNRTPVGADFSPLRTYMNTKLCNVLFTRRFARAIQDSGVTINANHPGVIRTGLGESGLSGRIMHRTIKRLWKSPQEGAAAPVWLATDPQLENTNGLFFDLKRERPYAANARNEILMESLYEYSWIKANLRDFYI